MSHAIAWPSQAIRFMVHSGGFPTRGRRLGRRGLLGLTAGIGTTLVLPSCNLPERGMPVPSLGTARAAGLGIANERFFPITDTAGLEKEFLAASERARLVRGLTVDAPLPRVQMLAVSGGAENGAFGAGLMCGWSEYGSRPTFDLVTGVSTGALTATFVFLGSKYDGQLRSVFTDLNPADIMIQRGPMAALFDDAMADNLPLLNVISAHMNEAMLTDIAAGYDDGRLLLVATTHLDARQPVIWNLGAIARSGHPKALNIMRRILLASAAVPGALPPTMIDVTLDGHQYQEMHVDGGAVAQAFLYPAGVNKRRREKIARHQAVAPAVAYVIRNGRLDPEWAAVERRTLGITMAAILTMITASGNNDIARMYQSTRRDGIDFNLAYIGKDFTADVPASLDQAFMRELFDYGYQRARHGYEWAKQPPG